MQGNLPVGSHQLSFRVVKGREEGAHDVQRPVGGHDEVDGIGQQRGRWSEDLPREKRGDDLEILPKKEKFGF